MTAAARPAPRLPPGLSCWSPAWLACTWFGVGLLPRAPGTWASLAALPLGWVVLAGPGRLALVALALALAAVGWWASAVVVGRGGPSDPGHVVIDEVAAQLLVLAVAPLDPLAFAGAFALFRLFDIWKPWPVSWADRRLGGGLGVMADDVLASAYAATALAAALRLTGSWT